MSAIFGIKTAPDDTQTPPPVSWRARRSSFGLLDPAPKPGAGPRGLNGDPTLAAAVGVGPAKPGRGVGGGDFRGLGAGKREKGLVKSDGSPIDRRVFRGLGYRVVVSRSSGGKVSERELARRVGRGVRGPLSRSSRGRSPGERDRGGAGAAGLDCLPRRSGVQIDVERPGRFHWCAANCRQASDRRPAGRAARGRLITMVAAGGAGGRGVSMRQGTGALTAVGVERPDRAAAAASAAWRPALSWASAWKRPREG